MQRSLYFARLAGCIADDFRYIVADAWQSIAADLSNAKQRAELAR